MDGFRGTSIQGAMFFCTSFLFQFWDIAIRNPWPLRRTRPCSPSLFVQAFCEAKGWVHNLRFFAEETWGWGVGYFHIYIYIYIYFHTISHMYKYTFTNKINVVYIYNNIIIYIYMNPLKVDILGQRTDTVICSFFATNGCVYWLGVHQNIEG